MSGPRGEYSAVGTVREVSSPGARSNSRATRPVRVPRAVTGIVVAVSVLVVALAVTAILLSLRVVSTGTSIPVVTDISGSLSGDTVHFSWQDPGLSATDRYQIQVTGGTSSIQLTPRFVVDASPGDHVCITVAVNRDGKIGDPSAEKCVDVPHG